MLFLDFLVFILFLYFSIFCCFWIFAFFILFLYFSLFCCFWIFSYFLYIHVFTRRLVRTVPVYAHNTTRTGHASDEDIASDRHRQSAQGTAYKTVNAAYVQLYTEVAYIQGTSKNDRLRRTRPLIAPHLSLFHTLPPDVH